MARVMAMAMAMGMDMVMNIERDGRTLQSDTTYRSSRQLDWRTGGLTSALAITAWLALSLPAQAQVLTDGTLDSGFASAGSAPAVENSASDAGTPRGGWQIVPTLSLQETFTTNGRLSASKHSDQITEISPGVNISGQSARLKGHLDFQLQGLVYAQDTDRQDVRRNLNSQFTFEAVDNWLFVDFNAVITRQSISAFGPQAYEHEGRNANSTEASSYQLSPYIRGKLGSWADYQLRYRRGTSHSQTQQIADPDTDDWSLLLQGGLGAQVGWSLDGNRQTIKYGSQARRESNRLRGVLSYALDPQIRLMAIGGSEANNYLSFNKERKTTAGFGLDWRPTERTSLSASQESRFFGKGHELSFSHRMRMSAIRYTDSRDVTNLPNQLSTFSLGSIYDLLDYQLQSAFPDPLQRAQQVMAFLQAYGLNANTQVISGFLSNQISLERRQALSLIGYGVRNTLTLTVMQSERQPLGGVGGMAGIRDDFSQAQDIRQRGVSLGWNHKLTALSSLNLDLSQQKSISRSTTVTGLDTRERRGHLGFTTRLGKDTSFSLLLRRVLYDNSTMPYSETGLVVGLGLRF